MLHLVKISTILLDTGVISFGKTPLSFWNYKSIVIPPLFRVSINIIVIDLGSVQPPMHSVTLKPQLKEEITLMVELLISNAHVVKIEIGLLLQWS